MARCAPKVEEVGEERETDEAGFSTEEFAVGALFLPDNGPFPIPTAIATVIVVKEVVAGESCHRELRHRRIEKGQQAIVVYGLCELNR